MTNHREKFDEVLDNLDEVIDAFNALAEQSITLNREGFAAARAAAEDFSHVVRTEAETYFLIDDPTEEDYLAFKAAIDTSRKTNEAIIMANHDMSHDAYRGLQVALKALFECIQNFFDYVAKQMGYDNGPTNLSDVVRPKETTRSLFDKSIEYLVNFFKPKPSGDHDAEHDTEQGEEHRRDHK